MDEYLIDDEIICNPLNSIFEIDEENEIVCYPSNSNFDEDEQQIVEIEEKQIKQEKQM